LRAGPIIGKSSANHRFQAVAAIRARFYPCLNKGRGTMMKTFALIAAAILLLSTPAVAQPQPPADDPMATIAGFVSAFNGGDPGGIASAHAENITIIDEVPPFIWRGRQALSHWLASLSAEDARRGVSGGAVALGAVRRRLVSGDRAYIVLDVIYRYRLQGAATIEPAVMSFALQRSIGGWKISGWTWGGSEPQPDQSGH
jgi:hypothetical protein